MKVTGWPWQSYSTNPSTAAPVWPVTSRPTQPLTPQHAEAQRCERAIAACLAAHDALAEVPSECAAGLEETIKALLLRREMLARHWA